MAILQERIISGRGILKVPPSEDYEKAKVMTLFADVIRRPASEYISYEWNPPESLYARISFLRGGYLLKTEKMVVTSQQWDSYPDISAQTLYATICAYQGTLDSFLNLGVSLGLVPVQKQNNIKDWRPVSLHYDEVKVVCYGSTAIRLSLRSVPFDICADDEDGNATPPPPPPVDPPVVPPGTPLADTDFPASLPYDDGDDGGDTVPFPGDEEEEDGTEGVPNTLYNVVYRWRQFPGGDFITQTAVVWGVYGDIRLVIAPPGSRFELFCQGVVPNPSSPPPPLSSPAYVLLDSRDYSTTVDLQLVAVTPR